MRVFTLQGYSKTGKTTSAEYIIRELRRRGYTVGSIKNIHREGFAIDTQGTNTDRHRKAGAQLVTARGLEETDMLFPKRLSLPQILRFYDHDFVVIEGGNELSVPKILTGVTTEEIDAHWQDNEQVIAICGKIATQGRDEYRATPIINAMTEVKHLVDLIIEKVPVYEEIVENGAGKADDTSEAGDTGIVLTIGGEDVPLNKFVEPTLRDTIIGFVKNLKGYMDGENITIKIKGKKN